MLYKFHEDHFYCFEDNKIVELTSFKNIQSDTYPDKEYPENARKLRGFIWRIDEKINTKDDLFPEDEKAVDAKIKEETSKKEKETMAVVNKIIKRYPEERKKSALLPVLHLAQAEFDGWLSPKTMDYVASILDLQPIEVYEVATFYSMYNLKPVGKYVFEVCQTGPCMISGSDNIIDYIKQVLNIQPGETTQDGLFTLKLVECLGACGYAPMMQVGKIYKEHLTKEKVDAIIAEYRQAAANKN